MPPTTDDPTLEHRLVAEFLDGACDADASAGPGAPLDDTLAALAALGLQPGSAVLLALSNSVHMLRLYLSALLLGLVPLAVAPATASVRVRGLAGRLGVRALIASRPDPQRYGALGVHPVPGGAAVLLEPAGAQASPYRAGDVLMSTSGTSGAFSACLHRVSSLLRNARRHARAVGLRAGDTVLVSLPLYYSYAMVAQVLAAYVSGARVVVAGPPFSPAGYLQQIADHGVTHSSVTPAVVRRLLEGGVGAPAARVLTVGGDRLPPEHVARLLADRPGGELYVTYGLTEAGPRVSTLAAHAEPAHRYASVGLPLPGVRVWLREPVGDDGTGELMVATDTALVRKISDAGPGGRTLAAPGVVATGDVFRLDDDGYLYHRGRLSDFVVIRGEKVSLGSVRRAAHALPGVVGCVTTVGVGEDGDAFVDVEVAVTDPEPEAAQRIRRALKSFLLPGERPRTVTVIAADPQAFHK